MKEEKIIKKRQPRMLEKIGEITLEDGIKPDDVIFFNGRRNVTLKKLTENTYEILGVIDNGNDN